MEFSEAIEWLSGKRSMTNIVPQDPFGTWQARIAEADAAMTHQAYWIVKAHREGLLENSSTICPVCLELLEPHTPNTDPIKIPGGE